MAALARKPEPAARTPKQERIEARLSHEAKALIEQAAIISGMSTSDFMISRAQDAAREVVAKHEQWVLNRQQSDAFVRALIDPPEPNANLRKAAERYKAR